MVRLWHVCLQMFSSSRHGGRKGGHVICGCNYYIISRISHCAPYHMGPPNPKWWMGRSLLICLSFYVGLICPYWAHGKWNYTSTFSPMIICPKFNWEFDMQLACFQTFHHLIQVISPMIGLNSHVKIQLVWVLQ